MLTHQNIERSLITKYRKPIWRKFTKAVREYKLIKENDHIAVCISGGKDSFLLAKCLEELQRHGQISFDLTYLVMDPGYTEKTLRKINENAKLLKLPIVIFKSNIFEVVDNTSKDSPCYLCARMRRGCLYKKAFELGCNKIALGHHFDDVVETVLLSMFYGGEYKSMRPCLHSTNFKGMELIRPLYYVREEDIILWSRYNNLEFINCACKFTEKLSIDETKSKRLEIKRLLQKLKDDNPNVYNNIFSSTENVNLDTILTYKTKNFKYSFLDDYE